MDKRRPNQIADANDPTAWEREFQKAVLLYWDGRVEEALQNLRAIRDSAPDDEHRGFCLADEALYLGTLMRCGEARTLLALARGLLPRDREKDLWIAVREVFLDYQQGRLDRAARRSKRLLQDYADVLGHPDPNGWWGWWQEELRIKRALALARLGRDREALPALEKALKYKREEPQLLYYIAVGQAHLKHYAEAKHSMTQAMKGGLEPAWAPSAHRILGLTEWRLAAHARALKQLEAAAALAQPGTPLKTDIYEDLALMWKHLGRSDLATHYRHLARGG